MSLNYALRPSAITLGKEIFLVQHVGTTRSVISNMIFEARSTDEPITKMTEDDYITVVDPVTKEITEIVRNGDKKYLSVKGTKYRVSFWEINEETEALKRISDETNTLRQKTEDSRRAAKEAEEHEKAERKAMRETNSSTKIKVPEKDKLLKKKARLEKRISTVTEDLTKAQTELSEVMDQLSEEVKDQTSDKETEVTA